MPNHVKTVVKFKNLKKPSDIQFILNMIADRELMPEDEPSIYQINFDKIIPEPRIKEDCPKDCIVTKDSHIMEDEDRPWFDWYEWHCKYWGTKWNAYDCHTEIGKSYVRFVFSTAWSLAHQVISQLGVLGYDIEVKYADEDIGNNCGMLSYNASERKWHAKDACDLIDSERFARNLWDKY